MSRKTPPFDPYPVWTEARFFQFIRTALRQASMRWPAKIEAKKLVRRAYKGDNIRQKWEYQCHACQKWFPDKEIEVHHKEYVGELKTFDDLPGFVKRLFCGVDGFEVNCKQCHKKETYGAAC